MHSISNRIEMPFSFISDHCVFALVVVGKSLSLIEERVKIELFRGHGYQ